MIFVHKIPCLCLLCNLQLLAYINPSLTNNVGALNSTDCTWCLSPGWSDTNMPVALHWCKNEPVFSLKCNMLPVFQICESTSSDQIYDETHS